MSGMYTASFRLPTTSSPTTSTRRPSVRASAAVSTRTPYQVLRVRETATATEIKTAYRSLAKRFHPDACVDNSQDNFIQIHDAYATLSDPVARERYDATSANQRRSTRFYRGSSTATYGMRTSRWETDQCW